MKTTHLRVVPILSTSTVISLLPFYAFAGWVAKIIIIIIIITGTYILLSYGVMISLTL